MTVIEVTVGAAGFEGVVGVLLPPSVDTQNRPLMDS